MLIRGRRRKRGGRPRGGRWAAAAVLVGLAWPFSAAVDGGETLLATLAEPGVTESSGLAASRRSPGLLWTHNDSGDGPLLYATDRAGRALGTWTVTGADNVDWEDLAIGPGADGNGAEALYVADTGDNARERTDAAIYRVAEPPPEGTLPDAGPTPTAPAERFPLVFPDGPHDVEALLVHPGTGEVVLIGKEVLGEAGIYRAPLPLRAGEPVALERVGGMALPGLGPTKAVTGGAVSADGRRVVVRTPFLAHEWAIGEGATLAEALADRPQPIVLPPTPRGEAIAYGTDGEMLLTSEGRPCPLFTATASDPVPRDAE
ncbi:MAG: hypothetical protein AVDCRST_MAG19-3034 [uncultured Thermomicrobiales bacterium]|uniref:Integral membrane protein n=1 Tax=uncultured Thermomicrobiales bacterium TaxID=1645740 RepID=A0A6J4VAU8_9BACT|nr:MAG: hypothetical protein AVDCRST_MAG19-3034 [uncultured Thermomicrobiales bacterium]